MQEQEVLQQNQKIQKYELKLKDLEEIEEQIKQYTNQIVEMEKKLNILDEENMKIN